MGYPIWDLAIGGSLLMALVAIPHVIVSHFAIGGGLLIAVTETLAVKRGDRELRGLAKRSSLVLILVSTVFGVISGVGIWVVAGLVSPGAISTLIHTYVWGWAIEWVFFVVEIVAALIYYATWNTISKRAHLLVGWIYFVGAYLSLVIINGIITFMLTPGRWLETGAFWDGFFNPTYWPSLVLRTGICLMMATAFMVFPAMRTAAAHRDRLVRYLGWWMVAGALVSYAGYRWWEAVLPDSVQGLFRGAAPALATLAATRHFALWALTAALVVAAVILLARPRLARPATAAVLALAAFAFFGGYERLREGARKPFLIHSHTFSNGLQVADIAAVNERGVLATAGWGARAAAADPAVTGREVFRAQCAACHTLDGYQSIRKALPSVADVLAVAADDPPGSGARAFRARCAACHAGVSFDDMRGVLPSANEVRGDPGMIRDLNQGMITATLVKLRGMGAAYAAADRTRMIDTSALPSPYMPPFVGTEPELGALSAHLGSLADDRQPRVAMRGGE
ncbi:MAG TPA: cytochrome ubiquinol oxidase subunit I [Thermoanaerobaculales bacterium]|nr:cytochrome ubiquinol oxidase subunit I [Thermoanaerobaculales bacterium]HQL28781.1 cytochrome ubiquinol oxidase subunit I [Thermoanaerobaculales bacterium]HQN96109.1 cytochrome ubiquinol oxidase subunit I [Thermoanaerobaculales bacterium]HQP42663.1 cytochrome ubiquinol oxidase subunit I [Thermoanaerobaculales bacterium]